MSNRLAHESSPYLRQHAGNPVDWWPWGEEALATARREHKPILLSIGYAACHWCHVMAHESFEDEATARVMNSLYVNIKLDREERPDIDKVYQLAHQALARRGGGWPLTVFLTPDDLLPFYAGTYFPKLPRHGLPSFVQVLQGVRAWFDEKPAEVRAQNAALAAFLADHARGEAHADVLDDTPVRVALERIADSFDPVNGGHRGAPKFPHAGEIELLLSRGAPAGGGQDPHAAMAYLTLARMAARGLADHLGGGFFRYCVDERWEIPHFEKMLYDNAQLLPLYARASRAYESDMPARAARAYESDMPARASHTNESGMPARASRTNESGMPARATHESGTDPTDPPFAYSARACAGWLAREMQAPGGGFWSSLDADSEGEEGRYYVWQHDDVRALLPIDVFAAAQRRYGLDGPLNFESHAWHLVIAASQDAIARELDIDRAEVERRLQAADLELFAARTQRVRPGLDDKILTAWNALLVGGVARAARWMPDAPLLAEAERALDFLHDAVWIDGRLFAVHAGGSARFPAYLDDHALLLDALLALLQVRWKRRDLDWAIALAEALLERFEDREAGGFFFTAHDAEPLPQRPKPWMDESLPAGNGVAARALLRLGHLLGEPRYLDAAERTLRAAWPTLTEYPHACCTLVLALDEFLHPRTHVVIRAEMGAEAELWRKAAEAAFAPDEADVYLVPAAEGLLPGVLGALRYRGGGVAQVCRGSMCQAPITDTAELQLTSSAQQSQARVESTH